MMLEPLLDRLSFGERPRAAYACMLGGADRDGRIETMRVDVPGVGLP